MIKLSFKRVLTLFSFLFLLTGIRYPVIAESEELIEKYRPLISEYFQKKGITYNRGIRERDPFLARENCGEKYHEYSISSINFIKSEKGVHYFRVDCRGFDSCRRIVVTHRYRVRIVVSSNRITHEKL